MSPEDPDLKARTAELLSRFRAADRSWMTGEAQKVRDKYREMVRRNYKDWSTKNPDLVAAKGAKRRALKMASVPPDYNHRRVSEMLRWSQRLTRCLGLQFHLDHIVPLAAGGHHNYDNLRPIPARWNQVKATRVVAPIPHCWCERTIET